MHTIYSVRRRFAAVAFVNIIDTGINKLAVFVSLYFSLAVNNCCSTKKYLLFTHAIVETVMTTAVAIKS